MGYYIVVITILFFGLAVWNFFQIKKQEGVDKERERLAKKFSHVTGIPQFIGKLYNDYFKDVRMGVKFNYPVLSSLITDVVYLSGDYQSKAEGLKTRFALKGKTYIFVLKQYRVHLIDETWEFHGDLELCQDNKKLLTLAMININPKGAIIWKPIEVKSFVEGGWVKDFQELEQKLELSEKNKTLNEPSS